MRQRLIRAATPDDADQIASIYNHYIEHTVITFEELPVTAADMRTRLETGLALYPWLVAELEHEISGYAYATQWKPRSAYRNTVETSVYVAPAHSRQGLGEALYRALLEHLCDEGFHCALGGIALPNDASVSLHEKLGFRKVGELEQVGWKFDRWVNVGYWQLLLPSGAGASRSGEQP